MHIIVMERLVNNWKYGKESLGLCFCISSIVRNIHFQLLSGALKGKIMLDQNFKNLMILDCSEQALEFITGKEA
jgi:hypothetical protein